MGEKIPADWKPFYITSMYKRGDRSNCKKHRGISKKAIQKILKRKLVK